jgi:hypothetical protein
VAQAPGVGDLTERDKVSRSLRILHVASAMLDSRQVLLGGAEPFVFNLARHTPGAVRSGLGVDRFAWGLRALVSHNFSVLTSFIAPVSNYAET